MRIIELNSNLFEGEVSLKKERRRTIALFRMGVNDFNVRTRRYFIDGGGWLDLDRFPDDVGMALGDVALQVVDRSQEVVAQLTCQIIG